MPKRKVSEDDEDEAPESADSGADDTVSLEDVEEAEEEDDDEVSAVAKTDPRQDSPADDAVLEQEELYEGIASDSLPSKKRRSKTKE